MLVCCLSPNKIIWSFGGFPRCRNTLVRYCMYKDNVQNRLKSFSSFFCGFFLSTLICHVCGGGLYVCFVLFWGFLLPFHIYWIEKWALAEGLMAESHPEMSKCFTICCTRNAMFITSVVMNFHRLTCILFSTKAYQRKCPNLYALYAHTQRTISVGTFLFTKPWTLTLKSYRSK